MNQHKLLVATCKKNTEERRSIICEKIHENGTQDLEKVSLNSDWLEAVEGKEGVKVATKEVACL